MVDKNILFLQYLCYNICNKVIDMKDSRQKQYGIFFTFFLSISIIVINFLFYKLPDVILYIGFVLFGLGASLEVSFLYFYNQRNRMTFLENRMKLWNNISYRVKKAGEIAFNEMALGIVVFNPNLQIEWANSYAKEIFLSPLVERNFRNIDLDLTNNILQNKKEFVIQLYGKTYECRLISADNILYLTDITEKMTLLSKYHRRTLALGVVNLDNFENALGALDAKDRSVQVSNLIGILTEWADKFNIAIKGYSDERYLLVLDQEHLDLLIASNFSILDSVREYCNQANLRVTASIGIACRDIDTIALMDDAYDQLELALNRGGNQAVVKREEEILYFGAKAESIEERTPVSIRFKTEELCELIKKASNIFILGHKYMDADAFGAAMALRVIAKSLDREAKIIFDENLIDETVNNILQSIKKEHLVFLNAFIEPKQALNEMTDESLLIIIDCQYQNLLMDEKIYKHAKQVAIIDHHRQNTMAIGDAQYSYIHSSASSSVEMVVEMFDFLNNLNISEVEATWMLLGIRVDTNNFIYRTTSRTFNVVAKLQTLGADMTKIRKYLREDFNDYVKKTSILNNMEILDGEYGVALCDDEIYERAFLAKVADNMIGVKGIKIAFCIGKISEDTVGISARSLDEANVQVIMERLGGGGHFNNAATQIKDITIEDAKALLEKTLKLVKGEERNIMKIILTKDVKGKGKSGDIIEVPNGFANHLLRNKQAIVATPDNIKQLEYEQNLEKEKEAQYIKEMEALKQIVDAASLRIEVKVGQNGKLFGSVSTKQIVDEFKKQYNIDLDKRKIILDNDINALGTYRIPIQLYKKIMATITLYVVEKE